MKEKQTKKDLAGRPYHDPNSPTRHKGFQFGENPMQETSFEAKLVHQEKVDREKVRLKQVLGMQGVDGGKCYDQVLDRHDLY